MKKKFPKSWNYSYIITNKKVKKKKKQKQKKKKKKKKGVGVGGHKLITIFNYLKPHTQQS